MTKQELINILENPFKQSQPWMLQGLGMLQLKLDDSRIRRLHLWDHRYEIPHHTEIHNHPWNFTSHILSGGIHNTIYREVEALPRTHEKINIKCGPLACVPTELSAVRLEVISRVAYYEGDQYSMVWDQIHSSKHEPGTITLIERTDHSPDNQADIYYRIGHKWISADQRPATNEEVLNIINEMRNFI